MTDTAETAVRRYLAWVDDPASAIDHAAVEVATAAFAAAADPIEKLHAAAALERARATDTAALERDFLAHAKAYADREAIPAAAFVALGVPAEVLVRAGFVVATARSRGTASGANRVGTPRAPQVPAAKLKAVALQMPKRFTLAQLADQAGGGSPATVRKAVEDLIADGRVVSVGPDANHSGPGRAPTLYELV